MSEGLIIIPTYNENENIEAILREVLALPRSFDVLVVDDSSPDGTGDIVKKMIPDFQGRLHLEVRKGKGGLGTAYIHGFKWALERSYPFVFEMDADFSHPPKDVARLHDACLNGADVSIGSRYVKGGNVKNWPWNRILMSYFASLYVRAVLGFHIKDTTAGFKCYKKEVLESFNFNQITFVGYAFQIEMKYAAYKKGFQLVEVPITFVDRKYGHSKMSTKIFREAFLGVLKMRKKNYD